MIIDPATFSRVCAVIARTFHLANASVVREDTTSADVPGWDSLSHAMLLMEIESEFGIDLPLDRAYAAESVAELAELVHRAIP